MEQVANVLVVWSYLLWQTAIILLVLIPFFAARVLWRFTGMLTKLLLTARWLCVGLLIATCGRMSWQFRTEMEVIRNPSLGASVELFFWSVAALVLTIVLSAKMRTLFDQLEDQFNQRRQA